ncbi:MAG: COQ9 family protein [Proteobacteria bacterium]|nr:COQ9 family protein [Pseudomonadota bacterium]MDA1024139.1 COQ9 family protein [Pseudomonadota bacterium]
MKIDRALKDKILLATLAHAAFDGWSDKALTAGLGDAGLDADMAARAFPGGVADLIEHASDWADRCMLEQLEKGDLAGMRVRDKVTRGVRLRLEVLIPHREAFRRLASHLALPSNTPLAARLMWRTVDAIWYAAGDEAADFNYYTKRGLLVPVYTATTLYWLGDESEGYADTWGFLERRIADTLKIPAYKARLQGMVSSLPNPFRLFTRPGRRAR